MRKPGLYLVFILLACRSYAGVVQLTAMPSSVNFQGQLGSAVPSQNVVITGPGGAQITAAASYGSSNPAGWFTFSPATFTSGQTVTVSLPSTNLASGTSGSITFVQNGTSNALTVPVTFTLTASGNGTLSASPAFLNLNFTSSQASQPQTVTITGPSNGSLIASVNTGMGPSGWLAASAPTGPPPATFTVTVNPANLPAGTTNGSVTVTQVGTNNFVTIPVSATVSAGTYTASPNPLNFAVNGFSPTLSVQNLTISGPNNAQLTATASVSAGGYPWLSVDPASGAVTNLTLALLVTVNPEGLSSGQTYTGDITIAQAGATVLTVPVTVTTSGTPTLAVTPGQFNFAWQVGATQPVPQIAIAASTGSAVNFTTSATTTNCGTGWLTASPATGITTSTAPVPITVSINTANLAPVATLNTTTCTGNIVLNSMGAVNSYTSLPVTLLVSPNPVLQISPPSVTTSFQPGGPPPGPWWFAVTNSSAQGGQLSFTATVSPGASGITNLFTISSTSSSTPAVVGISLNANVAAGLSPGNYTSSVVFTDSLGNSYGVPLQLNIDAGPTLVVSPSQLNLTYQIGQPPPSQMATVSSSGVPINFNAIPLENCGGISLLVSPTSGSTLTASGQNGAPTISRASGMGVSSSTIPCSGFVAFVPSVPPLGLQLTPAVINVVTGAAVYTGGVDNITATTTPGSTTPIAVNLPLTGSDGVSLIPWTVTETSIPQGQTWLSISGSNTGSTPGSVQVQLNPTSLAAGQYDGGVIISDNRVNSPVPIQVVPVSFIVEPQVTSTPSSLTFTTTPNGVNPAAQTFILGGVQSTSTIGVTASTQSCGMAWLNATGSGNTVTVGVIASLLGASSSGACTGIVAINAPGAFPNPFYVPVTVNIAGAISLSVSPTSLTFSGIAGQSIASQILTVTSTGGSAPFTATASSPTAGLITVTPSSGTTPGTVSVGLSQNVLSTLGAGTYTGAVTITSSGAGNSPVTVPVSITIPGQTSLPGVTMVENAATLQPGAVSPGEIISIFGANIGPATPTSFQLTSAGTVPTSIANTQVMFDNIAAPLLFVSAGQINAVVPYEIAGRAQTTVTVTSNSFISSGVTLSVEATNPGIFTTTENGTGQAAALNQDGTLNSASNAAAPGSVVTFFGTGGGQTVPASTTGSVTPVPTNASGLLNVPGVTATIGGQPATVEFAGAAPGLVSGVLQVNAIVPASLPAGAATMVLTMGGNASPSVVTIQVQ